MRLLYLSYNDPPSGVYTSQVIDVCRFIEKEYQVNVRLLALISVRGFWENRRKIKKQLKNAIVLPMVPKIQFWKWNIITVFFVSLLLNRKCILARGIWAS